MQHGGEDDADDGVIWVSVSNEAVQEHQRRRGDGPAGGAEIAQALEDAALRGAVDDEAYSDSGFDDFTGVGGAEEGVAEEDATAADIQVAAWGLRWI